MTSLKRQFWIFAGAFISITILIAILETVLTSSLMGVKIVMPMFCAMIAGEDFLKKHQRRLTADEKRRAVRGSFGTYVLISVVMTPLAFLDSEARAMIMEIWPFMIAITLVLFALAYLFIRLGYGWVTNKRADKLGLD